ncbi:MAG: glycosyltransferase family 39 protein [Flavobacteriales bacterium]|nr:glycosyltransferase family 39 protein [Flavobacteriales bacterium]
MMRFTWTEHRRDALLIALAALLIRLLALPWAHTVHADAVSRIHIAYEWLLDPHYIKDGYWGPLHHYLNALFMLVFPGKVLGPVILNILCASLTAIPLYGIAINLFGARKGAILTALLYVFAPIVMWTSLQPLSEVSYGLFLASSFYFLSRESRSIEGFRDPAIAGLFLTCAAATRYEAWVIIAAFTFVSLVLRPWRETLVFWCCAMLFPATWMIGNHLEFGDALYSVNQNDVWNMGKEGINDAITPVERFKRVVFFPWSFNLNVSPIVALLIAVGLAWGLIKRRLTRKQMVWLIPFLVMACVFQKKAWDGSLMLHHRFIVTWLVLLLPFVPIVLLGTRWLKLRWALLVIGALLVLPFTRLWNKVPYLEVTSNESVPGQAFEDLTLAYYREMEIVPRLPDEDTEVLLKEIDRNVQGGEGLLVDFIGWDRSYYLSLHAKANTKVVGGAKHEEYDAAGLATFFQEFPRGFMVLSRSGKLKDRIQTDSVNWYIEGVPVVISAQLMRSSHGNFLYSYSVTGGSSAIPSATLSHIFPEKPDALFFEDLIRKDEAWFNKIRRHAFLKHQTLEEAMRDNVNYMLEHP